MQTSTHLELHAKNEYLLPTIGIDTAETGPGKATSGFAWFVREKGMCSTFSRKVLRNLLIRKFFHTLPHVQQGTRMPHGPVLYRAVLTEARQVPDYVVSSAPCADEGSASAHEEAAVDLSQ